MPISNLSSNNSPDAIRKYRDNYDRAFPTTRLKVIVREQAPPPMDDINTNDKEIPSE